jgi:hypothetical protein
VYDELPDVAMKTKPKNHDFEQRINQSFGILRKSATAHQQLEMMDYRAGH